MKVIKKNQVIIFVIGLMLITAGYLNFSNSENANNIALQTGALADSEQMAAIGDATLVSTVPQEQGNVIANEEQITNTNTEENIVDKEVLTNAQITADEYFTKSRLERDSMYSQMLEIYQKIIQNTTSSEAQKTLAQSEISKINAQKNAIMITENLIKTKGFEDLIIFINDDSINVIIKSSKLEEEEIAQIQNIVTRELKAEINNIHISNKN